MAAKINEKIPTASVPPQQHTVSKTSTAKTTTIKVKENKWTENLKQESAKGAKSGNGDPDVLNADKMKTGKRVLTVIIVVMKFCVLGLLIASVGLQTQCVFNSNWGYDYYFDFDIEGRIYHSLWGYRQVGADYLFTEHKEGNWQDWKKPIIKLQGIASALGLASTLIQLVLVALTFVHPHKAVKVVLLTAVALLALGSGGLIMKSVIDFKKDRKIQGYGINVIYPTTILKTVTQEGYTQAFVSGATYVSAAVLSLVLIVLVLIKHHKSPTVVTPIKTSE